MRKPPFAFVGTAATVAQVARMQIACWCVASRRLALVWKQY
jgi:hypothetical protein